MSHCSHYVNMNVLQKGWMGARAGYAFLRLVRRPSELDEVFKIVDALEDSDEGATLVAEFVSNPAHADAFRKRPRLGELDLDTLSRLPAGTLGRVFADEMRARKLNPADIQRRPDNGTASSYVFAHLRETHDIWHTATGFDVDVAGELGLQAFYLAQFRANLALLLLAMGLLNTFFFELEDRHRRMDAIARGWQLGRRARPLFGFDWSANLTTPLSEIRKSLGIEEPMTPSATTQFSMATA